MNVSREISTARQLRLDMRDHISLKVHALFHCPTTFSEPLSADGVSLAAFTILNIEVHRSVFGFQPWLIHLSHYDAQR